MNFKSFCFTLLLTLSQPAFSCLCFTNSIQGDFDNHDDVFMAKLIDQKRDDGKTTLVFEVKKSWKGGASGIVEVETGEDTSCDSYFEWEKHHIMFVNLSQENDNLACNNSGRAKKSTYNRLEQIIKKEGKK